MGLNSVLAYRRVIDMKLSVIVVSYNTKQMTLDCLDSLYKETTIDSMEVIVIDNKSSDGSADAIAEAFPQVKLIKSDVNYGFAQGNNKAIEDAQGEYLLLLNPDTVVLDNAVNKLMQFAEDYPKAGVWGGRTLFGDGALNPGSCFRKMTLWNQFCRASGLAAVFRNSEFFNSEDYGGWQRNSVRSVDIVCGCFFLIKRSLWNELGGFDRRFFMYAEEADLCLRAIELGYAPMVNGEIKIIHYGGGSEKIRADKMVRLLSAKIELQKVHWKGYEQVWGRLCFMLWVVTRVVGNRVLYLAKKQKSYLEASGIWNDIWVRRNEWLKGYQ